MESVDPTFGNYGLDLEGVKLLSPLPQIKPERFTFTPSHPKPNLWDIVYRLDRMENEMKYQRHLLENVTRRLNYLLPVVVERDRKTTDSEKYVPSSPPIVKCTYK